MPVPPLGSVVKPNQCRTLRRSSTARSAARSANTEKSSTAVHEDSGIQPHPRTRDSRLEAIASRLEAIASSLEAIASSLEAIAGRLELVGWGPLLLGWRPLLVGSLRFEALIL